MKYLVNLERVTCLTAEIEIEAANEYEACEKAEKQEQKAVDEGTSTLDWELQSDAVEVDTCEEL
jgi:hypothetical protein